MGSMLDGLFSTMPALEFKPREPEPPPKLSPFQQALAESVVSSDTMMGSDNLTSRVVERVRELEAEKIGEAAAEKQKIAEAAAEAEDARLLEEGQKRGAELVEKALLAAQVRAEIKEVAKGERRKLAKYAEGRIADSQRKRGKR
jgi:hypothetical protein